jgi:hypothetical protein
MQPGEMGWMVSSFIEAVCREELPHGAGQQPQGQALKRCQAGGQGPRSVGCRGAPP